MKKKNFKNIAGLTLIEILVGVVVASVMVTAMYTSYNVVNNSYSKVTDRASISRSGRDVIEMLMRDIRMAGFKYTLGTNALGFPTRTPLEFKAGNTTINESHDAIIIEKGDDALGFSLDGTDAVPAKNDDSDTCCDRIHIVYDDFNQNDPIQPYKRYKVTYYALPMSETGRVVDDERYAVYKTLQSWRQPLDSDSGEWISDCTECYVAQKIRDHIVDMEFMPLDEKGKILNPLPRPGSDTEARLNLYKIKAVVARITFRSKNPFYRFNATEKTARLVQPLGSVTQKFFDKFLRDSIIVTIYTRNIGSSGV